MRHIWDFGMVCRNHGLRASSFGDQGLGFGGTTERLGFRA